MQNEKSKILEEIVPERTKKLSRGTRCPFPPVSMTSETERRENITTKIPNTKMLVFAFAFLSSVDK